MPALETNTAADRLHRIMRELYESQNDGLLSIWARILSVPTKSKLEVFRGILSVAALADEVEANVRREGGSATSLYLRSLDQVRHVLMYNIDGSRNNLNSLLKPEVVNDLEHCAARYSEIDHEIPVAREQINSIRVQVDELFQEVENSELSSDLRRNLLELLEVIRQQISQFQIRGVTALHECLRQSLARLMEIYPAFQNKKSLPILRKVVSVVTAVGTICENAQKALPVLKVATKLLPFLNSSGVHDAIPDAVDVEVLSK